MTRTTGDGSPVNFSVAGKRANVRGRELKTNREAYEIDERSGVFHAIAKYFAGHGRRETPVLCSPASSELCNYAAKDKRCLRIPR